MHPCFIRLHSIGAAIGIILLSVACPSVSDAAHCGAQGRCRGLKVVHSVPIGRNFLFTSSHTFAVGCIVQPQNTPQTTNRINPEISDSGKRLLGESKVETQVVVCRHSLQAHGISDVNKYKQKTGH